jgi:hypothetical protein
MLGARSRLQRNASALRCAYLIDVLGQPGLGPGAKVECAGRSGSPSVVQDRTVGRTTAGFTLDFHSAGVGSGHSGVGRHGGSTIEIPRRAENWTLARRSSAPPSWGDPQRNPSLACKRFFYVLPELGTGAKLGVRRTFRIPHGRPWSPKAAPPGLIRIPVAGRELGLMP